MTQRVRSTSQSWRVPGILAVLSVLAIIVVFVLRWSALRDAEASLTARGFSWDSREAGWTQATWTGLRGEGVRVGVAEARLFPKPLVTLRDVDLDLAQIYPQGEETALLSGGMDSILGMQPQVLAESVDIYWDDTLLMTELSGSIRPSLSLQGDEQSLTRAHYSWKAHFPFDMEHEHLSGPLDVEVACESECNVMVRSQAAVIQHPLLGPEPLPPELLSFEGQFHFQETYLEGQLHVADMQSVIGIVWQNEAPNMVLELSTPQLEHPNFSGPLELSVSCTETCELSLRSPAAIIEHPLLAPEALPPLDMAFQGRFIAEEQALEGDLQVANMGAKIRLTREENPVDFVFEFSAHTIELANIVTAFGSLIPNGSQASCQGTLGLHGGLTLRGDWDLVPTMDQLRCSGVLTDAGGLRFGQAFWTARDASGKTIQRYTSPERQDYVSLDDAGYLADAIIAAEDAGFLHHPGYELSAIEAALRRMKQDGVEAGLRGGSTITQQLAKNLFTQSSERTLRRKLHELIMTLELERLLTKDQILQLYINVVEFGPGTYGAVPAAEAMFMKRPSQLRLEEAAYLASVLPAPSQSWNKYYLRARTPNWRIGNILDNMVKGNKISRSQAEQAKGTSIRFVPPAVTAP